jgi:hypothetical protein
MDRFEYKEILPKPVGKCFCGEIVYEGDEAYQVEEDVVCDNSHCFKKFCLKRLHTVYGKVDKNGFVI